MMYLWRNPVVRAAVYQAVAVLAVAWLAYTGLRNALDNLAARGVSTGFRFLVNEAGFVISETPPIPQQLGWVACAVGAAALLIAAAYVGKRFSWLRPFAPSKRLSLVLSLAVIAVALAQVEWTRYQPTGSYLDALLTGLSNTITVALLGCVGATVIGFVLGIFQLSTNWLLRNSARVATELCRDVPLLVHVMFWYAMILNFFPPVREYASVLGLVHFCNRGLYLPVITDFKMDQITTLLVTGGAVAALAAAVFGRTKLCLILALLASAVLISTASWDFPELQGFNIVGGAAIRPEFAALLFGLLAYHSAFIADIVVSGIKSVPIGQIEAAYSLGLRRLPALRLVVIPQALRVVVPPLSLQYLGLAKNTSIGVAIAFPDLVGVSRTVLYQTGQAIEVMLLVMVFYLAVSFSIALATNMFNQTVQVKGW
jgi:general L-amino acid transport system permease protein